MTHAAFMAVLAFALAGCALSVTSAAGGRFDLVFGQGLIVGPAAPALTAGSAALCPCAPCTEQHVEGGALSEPASAAITAVTDTIARLVRLLSLGAIP